MTPLAPELETRLVALARRLVDPDSARVVVEPMRPGEGNWFGGGNLVEDGRGAYYLCGRYRNHGDSRTGLGAGERGLELAIFRSADRGASWEKVVRFDKASLDVGERQVVSIEGSALAWTSSGVELFVSTEKTNVAYGHGLDGYLKPGTGVWSIDRLAAATVEGLRAAAPSTVLESADPRHVHVKDPTVYRQADGALAVVFCTHPFCWSSSNSAYAIRREEGAAFDEPVFEFFSRGTTWDVAITRATGFVDLPRVGAFEAVEATLVFYDGGESLRDLDEHETAVHRPRGYSCEELGGLAYFTNGELHRIERLSRYLPELVSTMGTGCHRYVDVARVSGGFVATWERSREDRSQPLILNFVADDEVAAILA